MFRVLLSVVSAGLLAAGPCTPPRSVATSPSSEASPTVATSPTEASPSTAPVSPSALKITSLPFHAGEVAVPYTTVNMVASGGVAPYGWLISGAGLPSGLSKFGSTVGGTPSSAGTWSFTVKVVDGAGAVATANKSITVARHLTVTQTCPATKACQVEAGCV